MESRNRLELQIKQVKSLLSEFRKIKFKCLELSQTLGCDVANLQQYEITEVTCTRRINSLDILGVIKLKNELIKHLGEIKQSQRNMTYQLQKNSFKKAIKPPLILNKPSTIIQQIGQFQIPTYLSKVEPNQNKIDRLSDFIFSLGRSMSALRKMIRDESQWDEDMFFKYQPQYLQIMRRIEQFRMRDQQLATIIQQKYEKQLQSILSKSQRQASSQEFDIIKVPKKLIERKQKKERQFEYQQRYHPVSMIEPKRKIVFKKAQLQKINEQKIGDPQKFELPKLSSDTSLDLNQASLQRHSLSRMGNRMGDYSQTQQAAQNDNYVYMVKRISPDKMNSSIMSSISSLRSLRKKVFEDDIWDEFSKI